MTDSKLHIPAAEQTWHFEPAEYVVILGMGMSIQQWFIELYENPEMRQKAKVWTVNWGALGFNCDLVFNCHNFNNEGYGENVRRMYDTPSVKDKPIITLFPQEDMPNTWAFPYGKAVAEFNTNYLENSVAYAICGAIMSGAKVIRLFGCDYNYMVPGMQNMYEHGRSCVEFWLGIAHARGINVGSATSSTLLDTCKRLQHGSYGFFDWQPQFEVTVDGNVETMTFTGFRDPREEDRVLNQLIDDQEAGQLEEKAA